MRRIAACFLFAASTVIAADWPQFRGPAGAGVGDDAAVPTTWSPTENVKWKADLPGRSAASPVVFNKRVYVTTASGVRMDRLHVLCLDAVTGKTLWHRQFTATGNTACHPKSSMAAPSPCVNADGVYCIFATADVAALDLDGNLKWFRSLVGDYPDISNQIGMAQSPILWKDRLIVPMDSAGDSFLAAVDTKTGKNVWKTERPKDTVWTTPTLRVVGEKAEIVFASGKEAVGYNAVDGKKAWSVPAIGSSVPTAVTIGDELILPHNAGTVRLKPSDKGMSEVWKSTKLTSMYTSPLVYKDRVYGIGRGGSITCADLDTGKEVWTERISKGKGQFWASPIAAGGHVYTFDDAGIGTVIEAGSEAPNIVATNDLKAEILGTPAIADGCLFIQTVNGMYCIGK